MITVKYTLTAEEQKALLINGITEQEVQEDLSTDLAGVLKHYISKAKLNLIKNRTITELETSSTQI